MPLEAVTRLTPSEIQERVPFSGSRENAQKAANSSLEAMQEPSKDYSSLQMPPVLEPPKRYGMKQRIEQLIELENIGGRLNDTSSSMLDEKHLELNRLSKEQAEKLAEKAKQTQKAGVWELLKKIGSCILAAVSFVLGVSLIATGGGTIIGGLLIASGVLSIVNLVMTETDAWDWVAKKLAGENEELKKKLAAILPTAVGVVTAIMGIAGTAATLAWSSIDWAKKIIVIAQGASSLVQGVTSIGKGVSEAKVYWTDAEITELKKQIKAIQFSLDRLMNQMQKVNEEQGAQAKQLSEMLKSYKASCQIASQRI
jgi:hypothetical protein